MLNRRQFSKSLLSVAFAGLASNVAGAPTKRTAIAQGYGPLVSDPNGLLDLPEGFSYRVISELGNTMADGHPVPDRADGMGCIPLDDERVTLVRNHELAPKALDETSNPITSALAFDHLPNGHALSGGTTNMVYNLSTGKVEREFVSLSGTLRNCSGGITPWGTWMTCEESVAGPEYGIKEQHGWLFEVPANATELIKAEPIKAMGRFNREAACVDPNTGIVYMTEDRGDSLFYRYVPKVKGDLKQGGQLQALAVVDQPKLDSRNWDHTALLLGESVTTTWIDLDQPESPKDDLRTRGHAAGAALFARGEGIFWGDDELYFCCTNGGAKQLGQIMKYVPATEQLTLFVESPDKQTYNFGDNLAVMPNGHLVVCEDQYGDTVDNALKGITPNGDTYNLARVRIQTEPAGACFSPDGKTMFLNLYAPTRTLAITGPWGDASSDAVG